MRKTNPIIKIVINAIRMIIKFVKDYTFFYNYETLLSIYSSFYDDLGSILSYLNIDY